jgi:integrase
MQAWFNQKLKEVLPNTAVAYLDDIRRLFKWALEEHKVRSNPCTGITEPKVKQRYREHWIGKDIATKLLEECKDLELKYCLFCALHAGMRKDEVVMSRPNWFSLERHQIRIPAEEQGWSPKDRTARSISLSGPFETFLKTDYPLRSPFMIAPNVQKGSWRYRYDFKTRFNNYVRSQGLEVTFHDLRRSFASICINEGINAFDVAEWLGDDIRVVQKIYGHLDPDNRKEIIRVFG